MSRAMLLPTPGDPYVSSLWLACYKKFCQPQAGQLYAIINSGLETSAFEYTCELFQAAGAKITTYPHLCSHGAALKELVEKATEDYVMVMEDDFYILEAGHVDRWFQAVEKKEVDAVVSPRGCCDARIMDRISATFHLEGKDTLQTNFWPCLVVIDRSYFDRTDMIMGAHQFPAGVYIPQINFTPDFDSAGDTFVWMSIQLRGLGLTFLSEDQYRLIDVLYMKLFPPPWVHFGSCSTSLNGALLDDQGKSLGNRSQELSPGFPPVPDEGIRDHFETKYAFWKLLLQHFPIPQGHPAAYFNEVYGDAIERSIQGCQLRPNKIRSYQETFAKILAPVLKD